MSNGNYALLDTKRSKPNKVEVPASAENCKGPHRWDPQIGPDGKAIGYVPLEKYVHEEYPKMLYHPEYGKLKEPNIAHFASLCRPGDAQSYENAINAYTEARTAWERGNRYKIVNDKKEEDKLVKKGWLLKQPVFASEVKFDLGSDEI